MAVYRCYQFNPDGRIIGVEISDQPDDDAAALWGAGLLDRNPDPACQAVEVWQLARRICRLERG
jgi:hypothetical protein